MATVKNAQNHPRLYFNSATPRNRVTEYWVPELGVDSMFKRFDNRFPANRRQSQAAANSGEAGRIYLFTVDK